MWRGVCVCVCVHSCLTLCDPMVCSPPGSSVHGSFQAGILSGLPFPTPRDLPNPGIEPSSLVSPALAGGFFTTNVTWEASVRCRQTSLLLVSQHKNVFLKDLGAISEIIRKGSSPISQWGNSNLTWKVANTDGLTTKGNTCKLRNDSMI